MIGVVLLVQFLPRLLKRDLRAEEQNWLAERQKEMPSLVVKQLLITNQNMDGKSLRELDPHRLAHVNITRVRRGDQVSMVKPDFVLHLGDVVMVVGPQSEMEKIKLVLGEETEVPMDMNASIATQDLELNSARLRWQDAGRTAGLGKLRRDHHPHPPPGPGDQPGWQHAAGDRGWPARGRRPRGSAGIHQKGWWGYP